VHRNQIRSYMKAVNIPNFVEMKGRHLTVSHDTKSDKAGGIPAIVRITQSAGSMSFQHDMTYRQARDMGLALLAMAAEVEVIEAPNEPADAEVSA